MNYLPLFTGLVIVLCAAYSFARYRDVTHPAVFMAPFFFYFYALWPMILDRNGHLTALLPDLSTAQLCYLLTIAAFFGAMQFRSTFANAKRDRDLFWSFHAYRPADHRKILALSIAFGGVALLCYMVMIGGPFGIVRAYSVAKGGGHASSGIVGEGILLSYPALMLLALHCRLTRRLTTGHVLLAVAIMVPHLLQGTLGGRRGPLFVSAASLFLAYFIARGRLPKFRHIAAFATVIPLAMIFLVVNRRNVYLGSNFGFDPGKVMDFISPNERALTVNDYVFGVAQIIKATYYEDFYFGYRYFVTFFIRPIPSFIWPTKFEDVGALWLSQLGDDMTFERATGVNTPVGSSGGSIADGFQEFSWGVIVMFFLLGRLFITVWERHRALGGRWTVALTIMLALSIYLPTQSFGAWGLRTALAVLPLFFIWRFAFSNTSLIRSRQTSIDAHPQIRV